MRIVFVGSNPSHLGSNSPAIKNLAKWLKELDVLEIAHFTNVCNSVTPNNRPLKKSEYEIARLYLTLGDYDKVVALGNSADEALTIAGIDHIKLPHPSPRNRKLNDKSFVATELQRCKEYLNAD